MRGGALRDRSEPSGRGGSAKIDPGHLATYALVVLGFVFIPGPAIVLTVARSAASGTRAGLATGAGLAVGDLVHTALAIVGISAVMAASATLFAVVKYAGAAYLVWLGIRAIRAGQSRGDARSLPQVGAGAAFRQAVVAEILNPKTALFFLAFLPQFVVPERGAVAAQLAVLGAVFVAFGFLAKAVFAVLAGRLGTVLSARPAAARWQSRVVGTIYCALGVSLAATSA